MPAGHHVEHVELVEKISAAPSKTHHRMGHCRYPLHFTSSTPAKISELWRIICIRRLPLYLMGASICIGRSRPEILPEIPVACCDLTRRERMKQWGRSRRSTAPYHGAPPMTRTLRTSPRAPWRFILPWVPSSPTRIRMTLPAPANTIGAVILPKEGAGARALLLRYVLALICKMRRMQGMENLAHVINSQLYLLPAPPGRLTVNCNLPFVSPEQDVPIGGALTLRRPPRFRT